MIRGKPFNQVVQDEPANSHDPVLLGFFQSIGIQKGKPFAPEARMKNILTETSVVGDATARTITFHTRAKDAYYYRFYGPLVPWFNKTWRPGGIELQP